MSERVDAAAVDAGVSAVFGVFPAGSWRAAPLREVVAATLRALPTEEQAEPCNAHRCVCGHDIFTHDEGVVEVTKCAGWLTWTTEKRGDVVGCRECGCERFEFAPACERPKPCPIHGPDGVEVQDRKRRQGESGERNRDTITIRQRFDSDGGTTKTVALCDCGRTYSLQRAWQGLPCEDCDQQPEGGDSDDSETRTEHRDDGPEQDRVPAVVAQGESGEEGSVTGSEPAPGDGGNPKQPAPLQPSAESGHVLASGSPDRADDEHYPYCPACGSCGVDGCCPPDMCQCRYPRAPVSGLVEILDEKIAAERELWPDDALSAVPVSDDDTATPVSGDVEPVDEDTEALRSVLLTQDGLGKLAKERALDTLLIRAALYARPVTPEPVGWRPIDSAPEGEIVLLYDEGVWDIGRFGGFATMPTATHWMPLPAPPLPDTEPKP